MWILHSRLATTGLNIVLRLSRTSNRISSEFGEPIPPGLPYFGPAELRNFNEKSFLKNRTGDDCLG